MGLNTFRFFSHRVNELEIKFFGRGRQLLPLVCRQRRKRVIPAKPVFRRFVPLVRLLSTSAFESVGLGGGAFVTHRLAERGGEVLRSEPYRTRRLNGELQARLIFEHLFKRAS